MTPEEHDDAMFERWKGLLVRLSDIDRELGDQRIGVSPHEPSAVNDDEAVCPRCARPRVDCRASERDGDIPQDGGEAWAWAMAEQYECRAVAAAYRRGHADGKSGIPSALQDAEE